MTTITIDRTLLVRMEKELFLARNYGGILRDEPLLNEVSAALSAPATAPDLSAAYIGAREDLAVWKKRALEAEETARQLNRALAEEVNGPTFMGEPVLPATTPEKTVKEIMEFVRHYAADTFSSATLEDKIRRSLAAPATAPEQMPLERDCICHQDLHIDGYSGGAAPEGLYGALWVVVEGVGKKYVLADQSSEPKDMLAPATAQAAEIERLKTESEERLQNCAALVAEVERLRKDAERYQWLAEYLVSDDESYDDAIVAATTVKEVDSVIDNAMKGTS